MALARALSAPDDELVERVVHGVAHDPDANVQRRLLQVLQEHAPERVVGAARSILDHEDPSMRLFAAPLAGEFSVIVALVSGEEVDEELRIAAMRSLSGTDALVDGVRAALATDRERLWRAAAQASERADEAGVVEALEALADALDPSEWPADQELRARRVAVARALASTLGTLRHTENAEALLVRLLSYDDEATVEAAARSLGAVGTVPSVAALSQVEDAASVLSGLATHVRDAIRTIQARAGGARGGVALASSDRGGELAVAESDTQGVEEAVIQRAAARARSKATER